MKLICLDTETTGFSSKYDRVIEIGCVTLETNETFQRYINPNRSISESAIQIHGLTKEFLADFECFKFHAEDFLKFIENATLIAHNAKFDIGFLNAELERNGFPPLKNKIIDTLELAKQEFPGKKINLNALQKHYQINIERTFHGALLDAKILAQIYAAMQNKQTILENKNIPNHKPKTINSEEINIKITEQEILAHEILIQKL